MNFNQTMLFLSIFGSVACIIVTLYNSLYKGHTDGEKDKGGAWLPNFWLTHVLTYAGSILFFTLGSSSSIMLYTQEALTYNRINISMFLLANAFFIGLGLWKLTLAMAGTIRKSYRPER